MMTCVMVRAGAGEEASAVRIRIGKIKGLFDEIWSCRFRVWGLCAGIVGMGCWACGLGKRVLV